MINNWITGRGYSNIFSMRHKQFKRRNHRSKDNFSCRISTVFIPLLLIISPVDGQFGEIASIVTGLLGSGGGAGLASLGASGASGAANSIGSIGSRNKLLDLINIIMPDRHSL